LRTKFGDRYHFGSKSLKIRKR